MPRSLKNTILNTKAYKKSEGLTSDFFVIDKGSSNELPFCCILFIFVKVDDELARAGVELSQSYARGVEHLFGCDRLGRVGVLVIQVHDLGDAGLDDRLGAFVAGEKVDIQPRAVERFAARIEDRVQLGVDNVLILGILALALPREQIVGAAVGKAVVAGGQDAPVLIDDARADLGVRILGALCRQKRDAHKILVPRDMVYSFHVNYLLNGLFMVISLYI